MPRFLRYLLALTSSAALVYSVAHAHAETMPTHDLAFEEMLAHVYQDNPQLKAERENVRILDERVSQQVAGYHPQLLVTGAVGEARVSENSAPWHYGYDQNEAITLTQPIYNAATNGMRHAADKRVLEGRAKLLAAEQKVLFTAITAWLDLCEKAQLLNLDRQNQQLTHTYLDATNARLKGGDGTQTDVALAESRAADGDTRVAMAETAYTSARATFERATGLAAYIPALPAMPSQLPQSSAETLALAKNNPDIQQAEYEVAATQDDIDSATGTRWPYIYLRASMSDERAEDLGLSRLRSDSITINASFPLYSGGMEFSHEREAKIAHEKSRFDSITTQRNVNEEALQAWSRYSNAQSIIDASNRASTASDRALAGINEEQKHGTRTLTEVLDAQSQSLSAKITALQAESDVHVAAYRLLASVGKLTAQGMNLPTTVYNPVTHYEDVRGRWFGTEIE